MTNSRDADPHSEYRRQAAEHFARLSPPTPTPPPPRIFRGPDDPTQRTAPQPRHDEATQQLPSGPGHEAHLLGESTRRFAAGTTYAGPAAAQPNRPPMTPPPPTPNHLGGPTEPMRGRPGPPLPPPTAIGHPPAGPVFNQQPAAPGWSNPAQGGQPYPGATGQSQLNLQPHHALWILTGLSVIVAFVSGFGWLLVAAGCAFGGWYTLTRHVMWPPDIEDMLVRVRLTVPTHRRPETMTQRATATGAAPMTAPIPLRPLTIPELLGGAAKIVLKNWPVLIGIPVAILVGFVVIASVVMLVVMKIMADAAMSMIDASDFSSTTDVGSMLTTFVVMWIVLAVAMYALALPADALLIALSVIATDKAVRGERVRLAEVFRLARGRMFAVCRLTLTYYLLFLIIPDVLFVVVFFVAIGVSPFAAMPLMVAITVGCFLMGIVFSLAPIVLVVEKRGVADSMKRSAQLAKPAWGRLLAIHLLWAVCVTPLLLVPSVMVSFILGFVGFAVFWILAFGALIAYFRTLQMLIYTDLRMRQEGYDRELVAAWSRNTGQ